MNSSLGDMNDAQGLGDINDAGRDDVIAPEANEILLKRRRCTKSLQRDDIVDGQCVACVLELPLAGTSRVDIGRLLGISGDLPRLFEFCGRDCSVMFYGDKLARRYQINVLSRLLHSAQLSDALGSTLRVGDSVLVHADPRTGVDKAVLLGEGKVVAIRYNSTHGCAVFSVRTCDALVQVYPDGLRASLSSDTTTPALRMARVLSTPNAATSPAEQKAAIAAQRRYAIDQARLATSAVADLRDERYASDARLRDARVTSEARLASIAEAATTARQHAADKSSEANAKSAEQLARARKRARDAEAHDAASTTGKSGSFSATRSSNRLRAKR